jgi:hypothetical protein
VHRVLTLYPRELIHIFPHRIATIRGTDVENRTETAFCRAETVRTCENYGFKLLEMIKEVRGESEAASHSPYMHRARYIPEVDGRKPGSHARAGTWREV